MAKSSTDRALKMARHMLSEYESRGDEYSDAYWVGYLHSALKVVTERLEDDDQ